MATIFNTFFGFFAEEKTRLENRITDLSSKLNEDISEKEKAFLVTAIKNAEVELALLS